MSSFTILTNAAEQRCTSEDKDEEQSKPSLANPEAKESGQSPLILLVMMLLIQAAKRRRSTKNGDISNRDAKRLQRHDIRDQVGLRPGRGKDKFIKSWLSTSRWSRRSSADNKTLFGEVSDDMPRKVGDVLPSPSDSFSFNSNISSSRKTEKSTASVHDTDYRNSLRYRNIYINHNDPSVELVRRATRIISRSRASPEMDDPTVQELRNTARRLENEAEDVIVQQLAPGIVPAMKRVPDSRLASNADQPWFNSVPVSLNPNVLINALPLPGPKPDLAFGYSEMAFTEKQLMTIDLLIDDQFGRSYAMLDQKLRFPFLDIEFKSQAKNGTHYIATNQVAGAGAIALNGNFELYKRSYEAESFDFDEPQFFSVTMDHQLACVNVHWLSTPTDGGENSFHAEGLSQHLLRDPDGLRAVTRAIKNILDYGSDARLRKLCKALDAYRGKVILERKAVATERNQEHEIQSELRPKERRRSRKIRLPSHDQEQDQRRSNLQAKEGAIVHAGEEWPDRSEGTLQVERRRHDAPLPPSTHPRYAADKPRMDLQQGLRRQSQRLQDQRQNPSLPQMRLATKVSSEQTVHNGKPS